MLQKTPIPINFSQGLDQKTDDKQVQIGKFLQLKNSVFSKGGRLTKRNGFKNITTLPNTEQTTVTTLNDNLIATGSNLYIYSSDANEWLNQGKVQPISLDTQALVRSSSSQTSPDTAVAPTGLTCLVYVDNGTQAYYQVSDSTTGQQIVQRTALPATATSPRVFILGQYFIITFIATVGTPHLQYISIPMSMPSSPGTATDVSTDVNSLAAGYDAIVANNTVYFGWAASGNNMKLVNMSSTLVVGSPVTILSHTADLVSMTADISGNLPIIWISFWDSGSNDGFVASFSHTLLPILVATQVITNKVLNEMTSVAVNGSLSLFYENLNYYNDTGAYPNTIQTDYISKLMADSNGLSESPSVMLRSVGLASKSFIDASGVIYMVVSYGELNQPTYFLIDSLGNIYMRLAYSNGGGYTSTQVLPNVTNINGVYYVPYEIKDFLASVNKTTDLPSGTPTNGIYTQTGINLAIFEINESGQHSSNVANALHLTGGQLWEYDGVKPVEHGFHVWPENVTSTTATTGGSISSQPYFYVFTYEWTDNQGNLHRSAPSIPLKLDLTSAGTSTNVNTLYIPTLRLTYKTTPNAVRIVGYRWSTSQQAYYQFTSILTPTLNNPSVDYVTIIDTKSDAQILGQTLLYTTGGVIENIAAPASIDSALYKNRLFLIDAEDRNLLWYSKQIIQNTPVEMSDLFTLYVAPTSGAQGSTGDMTAISAMDDKLIIFKKDAIYYVTGNGPDNTGANNDFSEPTFITASVGCENPDSVVLTPQGIMFQSDKGIWLLGRDLNTSYIGAAVDDMTGVVKAAQVIPGTNEVRFVMADNVTLMYDYYYGQWGTFNNRTAISSTLYQGLDTYLNTNGEVYQETPGTYLDGSAPVLMSFKTSWINIAGVQGYERFYYANLLGSYFTPFKLNLQIAYDYNPSNLQSTIITPDNSSNTWGSDSVWGSGPAWGGTGNVFSARLFPQKQKCEAFQITMEENYDFSSGVTPGQGLTLSGLLLTVGIKKGTRTQSAKKSFG